MALHVCVTRFILRAGRLLMPNSPEYLVALYGTWMAGGIAVPINPLMVAEEVAALRHTTCCRLIESNGAAFSTCVSVSTIAVSCAAGLP